MMGLTGLFSLSKVNTGRQYEFDLAKTLAILLMIVIHVYEILSTGFCPSFGHTCAYVVGSIFAATTFMMCMGTGMVYTRHNTPEDYISRGFHLITIGFVLEIFRNIIPVAIALSLNVSCLEKLVLCVNVDILQFAGLVFIFVGLLKKWNVGNTGILLISVAFSIAGTLLEGVQTGNYGVDQVLGFFWGTRTQSYFPLLNWFIFVAAGQWFGEKYQYLQDKDRFHLISLLVGSAICAVYVYVSFHMDQNLFKGLTSEQYLAHRPFADALVCLPINVALISLCYFLGKIIPQKAMPVLTHPSRHINQYYCISWVIICDMAVALACKNEPIDTDCRMICFWLIVLVLTVLSVIIYNRFLQERVEQFFGRNRTFWTILVWTLCIGAFIWALCNLDEYPNFLGEYSVV